MPQVRSDGAWTDHVDEGLGDPALLPGWCGTRAAFDCVRSDVRAGRRALTLDWRGHGASSPALVLHLVPASPDMCSFAFQRAYMAEHSW